MATAVAARAAAAGRSIAWPIFALVIASVFLATIVYFVVTFSGPPPRDPPRGLTAIARTLGTGRQPTDHGPPLMIRTVTKPPRPGLAERWPMRADPAMATRLARLLGVPTDNIIAYTGRRPPGIPYAFVGRFMFARRTNEGWLVVENRVPPGFLHWHWKTLGAMLLTLVALAIPAWAIARTISRPLRQLARAAEQARAGAEKPPFPAGGPAEVRALTDAVSAMHDRLADHAEQRTRMLAAIAHDLGTPLSRLAFWVEQLPDAARDRATADIDEMRAMIADVLGFARDEAGERDSTLVDLGSLLDVLVEDMGAIDGAEVTLDAGPRAVVRGDPRALRRAFTNLVGNALRYGGSAAVSWRVENGVAIVEVEDRGPGIDAAQAERLFEPFVRGEASRNRATGGTGLGLTIVRAILARHQGSVTLANRTGGGAVATVRLPLGRG